MDYHNQMFNEDCIEGMAQRLPDDSIALVVTSIPFGSLFGYSMSPEDIGNNHDGIDMRAGSFGLHMRFCIAQLVRVMKPGCNVCIHIQQLLSYLNEHGAIGRRDFRGAVVDLFCAGGFEWKGEVVIPKNPQAIAQRLKLHSLMFATGKRNARALAPAVNDFIMIFQKPGESVPVPALFDSRSNPEGWLSTEEWIRDAHGVWGWDNPKGKRMAGVHGIGAMEEENASIDGYAEAQAWLQDHAWLASGIWDDIRETDVLDDYRSARGSEQERHVCPLQLTVIRRLIRLYTNTGELVLDPFSGIGSVQHVAIEQSRDYCGFELKESYYKQALENIARAKIKKDQAELPLFALAQGASTP